MSLDMRVLTSTLFLLRYAIKGSPTGKLLLEDIYYAIESRVRIFRVTSRTA